MCYHKALSMALVSAITTAHGVVAQKPPYLVARPVLYILDIVFWGAFK